MHTANHLHYYFIGFSLLFYKQVFPPFYCATYTAGVTHLHTTFIFNEKAGIEIFYFLMYYYYFVFLFIGFFHLQELYLSVLFSSK